MDEVDGICATFVLCCQLATLSGQESIKDLTGCWEHQVNDDWHLSFNGHLQELKNSNGDPVPPCSVWVKHSKYFATGIVMPYGGIMLGGHEAENDLIGALESAIRELGGLPATDEARQEVQP